MYAYRCEADGNSSGKSGKMCSSQPGKSIGIYDKYGSITPGKVANAVLLDRETLEIKGVILKGQML